MRVFISIILSFFVLTACEKPDNKNPFDPGRNPPQPPPSAGRPGSIGIIGDTADIKTTTLGGMVIMGGSTDVDAAFQWMISRSGGGDVVIIRASGTDAYNPYVKKLGTVNSVETLMIDSRRLAQDDGVARIIRNAEMLFIAGGDQSDYMAYWRDSKVEDAINYLMNEKKVPVGGTSAGAAILGNYYFSGERSSVTSSAALANPYVRDITLYHDDFLKAPFLQNVIVDQHFTQRERQGRLMVFLGRIMMDWDKAPFGIGVDEKTAVCIDDQGIANVIGENSAYFLKTNFAKKPEQFVADKPVTWNQDGKAVFVSAVAARAPGNQFNMHKFEIANTTGVTTSWWSVVSGAMRVIDN